MLNLILTAALTFAAPTDPALVGLSPARSLTWEAPIVHLPAVVPSMTECLSGVWECRREPGFCVLQKTGHPNTAVMGGYQVHEAEGWTNIPPDEDGDGGWFCY